MVGEGHPARMGLVSERFADTNRPGRRPTLASTQMIRVDAYGLLPSILIVLMSILAILGVVAHAAAL
jgi:hypothetical protein